MNKQPHKLSKKDQEDFKIWMDRYIELRKNREGREDWEGVGIGTDIFTDSCLRKSSLILQKAYKDMNIAEFNEYLSSA